MLTFWRANGVKSRSAPPFHVTTWRTLFVPVMVSQWSKLKGDGEDAVWIPTHTLVGTSPFFPTVTDTVVLTLTSKNRSSVRPHALATKFFVAAVPPCSPGSTYQKHRRQNFHVGQNDSPHNSFSLHTDSWDDCGAILNEQSDNDPYLHIRTKERP